MTTPAPDALRLVPAEPTEAMLAAWQGWREYDVPDHWPESLRPIYGGYRAMLSAAPAVQPAAGREEIARLQQMIVDCEAEPDGPLMLSSSVAAEHAKDLRAILAAISTPAQASGEAVAWRHDGPITGTSFYDYKPDAVIDQRRFGGTITPLYAHPPAQASETGGDRWPWLKARVDTLVNILAPDQGEMLTEDGRRLFAIASAIQSDLAALSAPQAAPGEGEQS